MKQLTLLHPRSVVSTLMVDRNADIWTRPDDVKCLQHCLVVLHPGDLSLALAMSYAWPDGYGRSLPAILLGHKYKSARRTHGAREQFHYGMFNFPQADAGYLRARSLIAR
jgi:hypothetical protein